MKTSPEKYALMGGKKYYLNDNEDQILYGNRWYTIYCDQDGDFYFFVTPTLTRAFRVIWKEKFGGYQK